MSFVKLALRIVLITAIVAYFVVAAGLLVARYYVLPRVDQWRPDIEKALSEAVGTPVTFDAISAEWRGLNADLTLTNLTIRDENGVAQLGIPKTDVILSWRSLFAMQPVFRYVGLDDVIVVAMRAPEGNIFVGGFDVSADDDDTSFWQSETMRWLLAQGRLNIQNSRLVWVDQQDNSVPLVFNDIDITADNGLFGHQLNVRVTLPESLGGELEAVAHIDSVAGSLSRFLVNEPDGYIYASFSELFPQQLAPWVDVPAVQGSFGGRIWLDIQSGKFTNFSATVAGRDAAFSAANVNDSVSDSAAQTETADATQALTESHTPDGVTFEQFRWQANGPLAMLGADVAYPDMVQSLGTLQRVTSSLTAANGIFRMASSGMQPIKVNQLSAQVAVSRGASNGLKVDVQDLALANDDGLVTAQGSWAVDEASAAKLGELDINGTLARFDLSSLSSYMPAAVDAEARQWMASAFEAGSVPRATFQIKGSVDDFPYGASDGPGTFRVDGNVQDVSINYANQDGTDGLPWPLLTNLIGKLELVNDRIGLDVSAGALTLPKGQRITLSDLSAQLVDLENKPVLTINGHTQAPAQNYLALFDDTALKDIAPAFVREFKGKGDWEMPLALRVPLDDVEQTEFQGELAFNGGEVVYASSPTLTNVQGAAILSGKGFEANEISATVLGGEVKLSGGVNETLDTIKATGKLSWAEVGKFTTSRELGRLITGDMSYAVNAKVTDETFEVTVDSDLVGTGIALPAPLGLSAGQTAKTKLRWAGSLKEKKPDTWRVTIANRLSMTASSGSNSKPFFSDMQVAIGSAKPLSGPGLTVAADLPSVNLDQWIPVVDTIRAEPNDAARQTEASAMPTLTQASLTSKKVVMGDNHLDEVNVKLAVKSARQYHVNLASTQTTGEINWALDRGKLQDGFHIRLDRLNIGNRQNSEQASKQRDKTSNDVKKANLPEPGKFSQLPMLDIKVDDLSIYGARIGTFRIKGRNSADNKQWQISELELTNPHAQFSATGALRFDPNPGLSLQAQLKIDDLGEMTAFLGHGGEVRKGKGTIEAKIDWAKMPWQFDYAGLSGSADLKLKEGVFDHVNSSSARVLELLSMQSLNRLLSANLNADESFQNGFPWSSIEGMFDIKQGLVKTDNLAVNSPVATISIKGDSNMVDETWDLSAVVRPNLDMSGTALATGFLVNPIVGLSALVGQYLLRNPVESALSQRFTVGGTWEKPIVNGSGADAQQNSQNSTQQNENGQAESDSNLPEVTR